MHCGALDGPAVTAVSEADITIFERDCAMKLAQLFSLYKLIRGESRTMRKPIAKQRRQRASAFVLDANDNGKKLGGFKFAGGVSLLVYSPKLHHLYLRGECHPDDEAQLVDRQ